MSSDDVEREQAARRQPPNATVSFKGKIKTLRNPIFKNENGGFESLFQNRRLTFVRYLR